MPIDFDSSHLPAVIIYMFDLILILDQNDPNHTSQLISGPNKKYIKEHAYHWKANIFKKVNIDHYTRPLHYYI